MKQLLLTTIAAVLLVGCGPTQSPDISIWEATATGNIEAVKQHLAAGTDLNTKNRMGWTPLHNAAGVGQKETVKLLITRGANVNAKDKDGVTPLDAATGLKQTETASILRKHGGKTKMELEVTEPVAEPPTAKAPDISIHDAAAAGDIDAVKQHIAAGADVNENVLGTPLHWATVNGHKEVAELLIAAGADVNAKDFTLGRTLLHIAAREGHKEVVELLLAKGVDVNAKDKEGKTPLDWAKRHPETADILRKHGGKTGEELKAE